MRNFDYMGDTLEYTKTLVDSEGSVNFGPLSLCNIKRLINSVYQVDCMDYRLNYTNLFTDFGLAFKKFIELKEALESTGFKLKEEKVKNLRR